MPRSNFLILLLLLPLSTIAQNWKTFSDTGIAFTAKYPANWVSKIKEEKRVFFTSPPDSDNDNFRENINVSIKANPAYGTEIKIKDAVPSVTESLEKSITDFKLESESYFKWNNSEAAELVYTGVYDINGLTNSIRITQWFCFWKGKLFTATFTALKDSNTHNENAKKILNSIVFK